MTRKEYLLTVLAEECVETAQRATKAIRFSTEEVQPNLDQNPLQLDNGDRLIYELNDILAVALILHSEGYIPYPFDREAQEKKKEKIEKYFNYSKELGLVDDI